MSNSKAEEALNLFLNRHWREPVDNKAQTDVSLSDYEIELDYSVMKDKPKGRSYTPPSLDKVLNRKREIRNKNARLLELRDRNSKLAVRVGHLEDTMRDLVNYTATLEQALWRANVVAELGKDTELVPTKLMPNEYPLIKTKYELQESFADISVTNTFVSETLKRRVDALRRK